MVHRIAVLNTVGTLFAACILCAACQPVDADQPVAALATARDLDADGIADERDNCVTVANADQEDRDHDGLGNACDACPYDRSNDSDGDGICQNVDNCPQFANPTQTDRNQDKIGDACQGARASRLARSVAIPPTDASARP